MMSQENQQPAPIHLSASSDKNILVVDNLHTSFFTRDGEVKAVNGLNINLKENTILGVVGESGSGKSASALSLLRLIPTPAKITKRDVYFKGINLMEAGDEELRRIRGKEISMIFQEPTTALNPLMNVGDHIHEALVAHQQLNHLCL